MEPIYQTPITVSVTVFLPADKAWEVWTNPQHVTQWNSASPEWHTPKAENDLRAGGTFSYRMEARDGSFGFDFAGQYDEVIPMEKIAYTIADGRKVVITFTEQEGATEVIEVFEAENTNPIEMQRAGWQAIMDHYKEYAEGLGR